ncbi:hypothetical protein [Hymenobacter sp.]|uniref:hypothetical protein n=1 Tax=Hymenobacter sp. TaxID=1898978 RepID=UPI00286C49CE|nr:hypothetical protein [Hymenobacter sp.]
MMKIALRVISFTGLALTALPAILMFNNKINFQQHLDYMLVGTLMWFLTAPFWVGKESKAV